VTAPEQAVLSAAERSAVGVARDGARRALWWVVVTVAALAGLVVVAAFLGWPEGWAGVGAAAAVTTQGVLDGWRAVRAARQVRACGTCRLAAMTGGAALDRWARCAGAGHPSTEGGGCGQR